MWEIDSLLDFMEENYIKALKFGFKNRFGLEVVDEDMVQFKAYFEMMVPFLDGRIAMHPD